MSSAPVFLAALTRLFQEGHALVFWNDAGGEFATQIDGIDLGRKLAARVVPED